MDQPPNPDAPQLPDSPRSGMTRRAFIKGVIASGAVASSAAYLFRSSGDTIFGQTSAPGSVERSHHAERQRPDAPRGRDEAGNARDDAALQAGTHRARRSAATARSAARARS